MAVPGHASGLRKLQAMVLTTLATMPPDIVEAVGALGDGTSKHPRFKLATSAPKLVKGRRNGPCHCGSGKKFKNCCIGKPVQTKSP